MRNLILLFSFFILISCNSATQETGKAQQEPVQAPKQEQPAAVATQPAQPVEVEAEAAAQPAATQSQAEVMLNPPHGQPYHRCDIPVGAPLDAPPATTTQQTTSSQVPVAAPAKANNPNMQAIENAMKNPSQTQNATTTANQGTKPRLNPPHGQPFHRCDIAVGSPLP